MSTQSVYAILSVSVIILWAGLWLIRLAKQTLTRRQLAVILAIAVVLTALSIFIHENGFAGTNHQIKYGWPHWYLTKTRPLEEPSDWRWQIIFGPVSSYIWSNIVFYFSVLMVAIGATKYFRRRN